MKKSNNKGFVLAETIVVTVFMVTIFTILYSTYFPIIGNYEKREFYDDVDSKYIAFWLKYMIQDKSYILDTTEITSNGYTWFNCNNVDTTTSGGLTKFNSCSKFVDDAGLLSNPYKATSAGNEASDSCGSTDENALKYVAIVSEYNLTRLKGSLNDNNDGGLGKCLSDGFIDYINSLPNYSGTSDGSNYRILVEIYDDSPLEDNTSYVDDSGDDTNVETVVNYPNYKYSSIEIKKD